MNPGNVIPSQPLHHGPDGFRNPQGPTVKTWREVWRWRRTATRASWPAWIQDPPQPPPPRLPPGQIGITFIGHASFLIQLGGRCVLVDPVWSDRAGPLGRVGPLRVRAPGQRLEDLPGCDLLLVSHNHYDHLDLPTLRAIRQRWTPEAATGLRNAVHLAKGGIANAVELDWWDSRTLAGLRVTYVPAQHFSARTPFDRNRSLWGGFVLEAPEGGCVYFAGDSGFCPYFARIGRRFPAIDVALLPIGGYAPRDFMKPEHMDPAEAVRAHLALGARRSVGMHFGTFAGLTDEPIDEPEALLAAARAEQGVAEDAFTTLPFGATLVVATD